MSLEFAYAPIIPPFAGAGQNESVVAPYMAALEGLGGVHAADPAVTGAVPFVYLVATGGTEGALMQLYRAREAASPGEPVLIVAHPGNNSLPASLESLARLRQEGAPGRIVFLRSPDDPQGLDALESALHDISVRSRLHYARIGLVGDPSDWLVASTPAPDTVRAMWGPEVVPVALETLTAVFDGITDAEVAAAAASLSEGADDTLEPSAEELADVARVYVALDRLVKEHRLDALTLRCFDLLLAKNTTGCFALSELTDRGVISGCEGDLVSTVGLMWTRLVTDQVPWMANPASVNVTENSLWLAHCTVPRTLIGDYRLRSHFESGIGVGIQGEIPTGPVTLARIGGAMMDELWLAQGSIVRTGHAENLCRTQVEIVLSDGHVSELLENPLGNHLILVRGHHGERLSRWWESML